MKLLLNEEKMKNDLCLNPAIMGCIGSGFILTALIQASLQRGGGGELNIAVRKKSLYSHSTQFSLYSALHTSLVSILQTSPSHTFLPPFYVQGCRRKKYLTLQ
jgi:hypothetical protein